MYQLAVSGIQKSVKNHNKTSLVILYVRSKVRSPEVKGKLWPISIFFDKLVHNSGTRRATDLCKSTFDSSFNALSLRCPQIWPKIKVTWPWMTFCWSFHKVCGKRGKKYAKNGGAADPPFPRHCQKTWGVAGVQTPLVGHGLKETVHLRKICIFN